MTEHEALAVRLGHMSKWFTDQSYEATTLREAQAALAATPAVGGEAHEEMLESGIVNAFEEADFAILYREVHISDTLQEITNVPQVFCREIARLIAAQPASPLRRRNTLKKLIEKQANDEGCWFVAETITEAYLQEQMRLLHAAFEETDFFGFPLSAPSPEQPAADPVTGRDDLGIVLSALRYFEEIVGEKFHDEGGVIAEIERDHKCHAAAPVTDRFGEPVWPNNDEANDLDKGYDA